MYLESICLTSSFLGTRVCQVCEFLSFKCKIWCDTFCLTGFMLDKTCSENDTWMPSQLLCLAATLGLLPDGALMLSESKFMGRVVQQKLTNGN